MSLSELFGDLDDEDDYRPDDAEISDIESGDEAMRKLPGNVPFSLGEELLKPMKPPEFDSDDDIRTEPVPPISSGEEETSDLTQLNKHLFGSEHEVERPEKPNQSIQNADDFFRTSDDDVQKSTAVDLFGSESDSEKPATQHDIFGSDVSVSDDEQKQATKQDVEQATKQGSDNDETTKQDHDELHALHRIRHSEGESEDEKEEESELPVEMPLVDITLGENLNLIKLPNFISIDTRPFDAETYEDEIEDDNEITDDEGRSRLKLKVENTMRWRHALDERGSLIKQSNSRIVKWSDGSISLFIGSEEFDIMQAPLLGSNSHLYVKHGAGIQGQAQFNNKMMFRIHSTDSYTHRKMTLRISDRVSKASKVKTLPAVGRNPEDKRMELCKKEEERIQAQRRRENLQKKIREKNLSKSISTRYLEPEYEEEEGTSLAAIKNSYKAKKKRKKDTKKVSEVYSSEEEEDEEEILLDDEEAVATDSDDSTRKKKRTTVIEEDDSD